MGIMPKNLPEGRMTKQHVEANHTPNTYQDHKSESSTHYPHIANTPWAFLFRPQTINQRCHVAISV